MKNAAEYNTLLSREDFKKIGFLSTGGMCCVPGCKECAVDAHHIMDRKLWSDGGYYLSNCAPLCTAHHLDAEAGVFTPKQVTIFAQIPLNKIQKPDKLDWLTDDEYRELFINEGIDKFGK